MANQIERFRLLHRKRLLSNGFRDQVDGGFGPAEMASFLSGAMRASEAAISHATPGYAGGY